MQFTFYGYADIATECMAACKVEGGPTYQIRLSGEASNVQYRFSHKHIDFGKQVHVNINVLVCIHAHAYTNLALKYNIAEKSVCTSATHSLSSTVKF